MMKMDESVTFRLLYAMVEKVANIVLKKWQIFL